MVAFAFNAQQFQPSYGSDAGLPDGRYSTVIINTAKIDKADAFGNPTSSYLEITHGVTDGPHKGQTFKDRLTLLHSSTDVVRIANQQLSAYCHVLQTYQFTETSALHNKPMQIEVGRQIDRTTKQPTAFGEIKKIFDANGNEPGKGGPQAQPQQPQHQPPPANQPPPAGVQAETNWPTSAQGQGGAGPAPQGFAPVQQQQPPAAASGADWGQQAPGQPQAQPQQGFGAPGAAPAPAPAAWGGNTGGAPAANWGAR